MSEPGPTTTYIARGSRIIYAPPHPSAETQTPARLPEPPFRRRVQRPSSIHIVRYPAGYIWCPPKEPPPPKPPSKLKVQAQKLASRENAKRVFDSVLSTLTSPFSASSSAVETEVATPSPIETPRSSDLSSRPTAPPLASNPIRTAVADSRRRSVGSSRPPPTSSNPRNSRPRPLSWAFPTESPISDPALASMMASSSATRGHQPGSSGRGSLSLLGGDQRHPTSAAVTRPAPNPVHTHEPEKPLASASGITMAIQLAEPTVYLTGFDHDGRGSNTQNTTALIRGKLVLNVTKAIKIKAVTLSFCGKARTEWPEGIPPTKSDYFEEKNLRQQVLPFYNAAYEGSETGYGAQCKYALRSGITSDSQTNLSNGNAGAASTRSSRSSTLLSAKDQKRLSLQNNQSRSFSKSDAASQFGPTPQQKGYKVFHPGLYEYSFELSLDHTSPETIDLPLGSVRWMLEALVERAGTFKPNLHGTKEVLVVRAPDQNSLEQVEPIAISRKWEDQLHYDIVISGKSFPLGSKIPIAFKLTPLAKVQCHRIKVFVTENCDYFTEDKKVTRRDAQRKILLFERQAGKPLAEAYKGSELRFNRGGEQDSDAREQNRRRAQQRRDREARASGSAAATVEAPSDNLLGDLELGLDNLAVQTEIEMDVQLPTCAQMKKDRSKMIHPDSTWKLIQVHHWIKIVMRLSRQDTDDPTGKKRRHFEISIDSPFHILSCMATQQHTALPEYSSATLPESSKTFECGCPNAAATGGSSASSSSGNVPTLDSFSFPPASALDNDGALAGLARPPQAHLDTIHNVQRPMHLLRAPSFNPPPFEAEEPPPPLPTPPPGYDMVIGTPSHDGLADYFARLADAYSDDDHTDDEDVIGSLSRKNGRVNVVNPRTPGSGRVASRSMDVSRNFMFRPEGVLSERLQAARRDEQGVPAT